MRVQVPFLAQDPEIRVFVVFSFGRLHVCNTFRSRNRQICFYQRRNGEIGAHRPFPVHGTNLTLDVPRAADAPEVAAACQDPEIQRFTTVPVPFGPEHADNFLNELCPQLWDEGGASWIIRTYEFQTPHVAGTISLRVGLEKTANVGYWMAPEWRGRGLMREALQLALTTAFNLLGF